MVRDLAEFGKPNVIINTSKISYVSIIEVDQEWSDKKMTRTVNVVCDGALLNFPFFEGEEDKAGVFFEFLKSEINKLES